MGNITRGLDLELSPAKDVAFRPQMTALARREEHSIEPTSMPELMQLAAMAGKTGFFGAKNQEQALLIMMAGRDLGLSYSQSLRAFHVIEGRPALSADGMVAACLVRRDVCEYFRTVESTDQQATVATRRVGLPEQTYTFSMKDAKLAGLAGRGTWQKYPSRMLLARAKSGLARDVYADLLLGLYDPDELAEERLAPPARVEMQVAPAPVVEAKSESARESSSQEYNEFVSAFALIGREGTVADYGTLAARIAKSSLSKAQRNTLAAGPAKDAKAAIAHRSTAKVDAEGVFEDAATGSREPGEEG